MKYLSLLFLGLIALKCTKNPNSLDNLNGTWVLEEYCVSIGDKNCHLQKAETRNIFTIEGESFVFESDSHSCSGNYELVEDALIFSNIDPSECLNGRMFLKVLGSSRIEINPLCFEPCRYIYKKQ